LSIAATTQFDPNASPFELQPIEGLPLTDAERAHLAGILDDFARERVVIGGL